MRAARGNPQRRRWESNPLEPGCSRSPRRLAPASSVDGSRMENGKGTMPSPGIEPGLRPSQGRVRIRHTPRTRCRSRIPRPGIGPGLAASKTAVPPTHSRGGSMPARPRRADRHDALARSRTWSATFGGSRAIPSHSEGRRRDRPRSAGTQGFEPCPRVLEARCSPRNTSLSEVQGIRRELNPSPRDSRSRVLPLHHEHHRVGPENLAGREIASPVGAGRVRDTRR